MSQLTLTPQEDILVLNCVLAKSAQFANAYGVEDADLVALLAKIQNQLASVMAAPVVEPAAAEEPAAVEAFVNDEPHEQFTHEEDKAPSEE